MELSAGSNGLPSAKNIGEQKLEAGKRSGTESSDLDDLHNLGQREDSAKSPEEVPTDSISKQAISLALEIAQARMKASKQRAVIMNKKGNNAAKREKGERQRSGKSPQNKPNRPRSCVGK